LRNVRSARGVLASKTRDTIFTVFGEKNLPPINTNSKPSEITEWKAKPEVKTCYQELFTQMDDKLVLTRIAQKVLKKNYSKVEMAFVVAICVTILNPKIGKLKLSNRMMKRRMEFYLVSL
jgi:hypothetical protein